MRRRRARVTTGFVHRKVRVLRVLAVLGVLILPLRVDAYVAVIAGGRTSAITLLLRVLETDASYLGGIDRVVGIGGRRKMVAHVVMVLRQCGGSRVCAVLRRRQL